MSTENKIYAIYIDAYKIMYVKYTTSLQNEYYIYANEYIYISDIFSTLIQHIYLFPYPSE